MYYTYEESDGRWHEISGGTVARADDVVLIAGAGCGACPSEEEPTAVVWPAVAMLLRCFLPWTNDDVLPFPLALCWYCDVFTSMISW